MTYTYIDNNGKPITNVYNARDSYSINQYIARFTPSIVKKETSSNEQHKAYVNVDKTCNPFDISKLAKASGIKF